MSRKKITVFTPTYNRSKTIVNLYSSLLNQTNKQFEWIIYDDGSTDNTEEVVNKFINENVLDIKYIYSCNKGKHVAINNGVELAKGELFFIVDSDDIICNDSIENIINVWNSIDGNKKNEFAGVVGRKENISGKSYKFNFDEKYIDKSFIEFRKIQKENIERADVFSTNILKKYKFPEFEGENFMAESVIWYKIASDGYKMRWFNNNIYMYEYLEDGLTRNFYNKRINNINGTLYVYNQLMSYNISLKDKIKYKINYFRYGLTKFGCKQLVKGMNDKRLYILYCGIGYILKIRDSIKFKKIKVR